MVVEYNQSHLFHFFSTLKAHSCQNNRIVTEIFLYEKHQPVLETDFMVHLVYVSVQPEVTRISLKMSLGNRGLRFKSREAFARKFLRNNEFHLRRSFVINDALP